MTRDTSTLSARLGLSSLGSGSLTAHRHKLNTFALSTTREWITRAFVLSLALAMLLTPVAGNPASGSEPTPAASTTEDMETQDQSQEVQGLDFEAQAPAQGTGIVRANSAVNIRRGPHSGYYSTNGSYANGTTVTILCKTFGQSVSGPAGSSNRWYKTGGRKYVSGGYLEITKNPGNCTEPTGDDYTWSGQCPATGSPPGSPSRDPWGYTKGQCTSFVSFRAQARLTRDLSGLGNAREWNDRAPSKGISVGTTPLIGAVAVSESGPLGHVAYVTQVNSNYSFTVEEYNVAGQCEHGVRTGLTLANSEFSSFIYP